MSSNVIFINIIFLCFIICHGCITKEYNYDSAIDIYMERFGDNQCEYIEDNFHKLKGNWYYIARIVDPVVPSIHCGRLSVNETSRNRFVSHLSYQKIDDKSITTPMNVQYVDNKEVLIHHSYDDDDWKYPFFANIVTCKNNTIFFINSRMYFGRIMVFTREVPDKIESLETDFMLPLKWGVFQYIGNYCI